jgi:hypothetical protein
MQKVLKTSKTGAERLRSFFAAAARMAMKNPIRMDGVGKECRITFS